MELAEVEAAITRTVNKIHELEELSKKHRKVLSELNQKRYELKRQAEAEAKAAALAKASVVLVDANFGQASTPVKIIKTEPGEMQNVRGKQVRVGVEWDVYRDGAYIGTVSHRLFTRERRSQGLRYVNARWQSLGWGYTAERGGSQLEARSKKDAVERIVRAAGR